MKLVSPLVSGVAVLMVKQLNIKEHGVMNTAVQPRPNVRRVRKSQNEVRAERVKGAPEYYRVASLREPGASLETVLSDFLSDIRHLCDRLSLNLAQFDQMAHRNYFSEKYPR